MEESLSERVAAYIELSDHKLLRRLPLVIILNGRAFSKATSLLDKPYAPEFSELMISSMVKLSTEVDGMVFAYTYNDQIVLVLKNDQNVQTEAWYQNRIQAIASASASIASVEFNRLINQKGIRILGDPIFTARVFAVPSITELANVMIHMQQNCFHLALSNAAFYELWKVHGTSRATAMLDGKTQAEKASILRNECGKDFTDYPTPFKRGVAAYRVPRFNTSTKEIKHKITINDELPLFSQDKEWLYDLLKKGSETYKIDKTEAA